MAEKKKAPSYAERLVSGAKDFYKSVTSGNPVTKSLEKAAGKSAPAKETKKVPGFRSKLREQIAKDTAKKRRK